MAQNTVTTPVSRDLLPPLLACLPIAFLSPRPPPALLPLLTPILRQRVSLLSNKAPSDSWLTLLSWDREAASKLPEAIETIQIEPHPVSGEVEIQDPEAIEYRRLDHETIHARLHLPEFNLLATYLWCMGETREWLLSELRTLEDLQDAEEWFATLKEADVAANPRPTAPTAGTDRKASKTKTPLDEDNDSAYWAAYDATPEPGRTPATKRSPAPGFNRSGSTGAQAPSNSELEYFARYMNEVQPALDPEDPDEEGMPDTESTLKGNALQLPTSTQTQTQPPPRAGSTSDDQIERFFSHRQPEDHDSVLSPSAQEFGQAHLAIQHPRPSSSSSSGSVARLERKASIAVQAEIAVKQHISTDIKSLFRLARAAGIDRGEFERIVKTELDVLAMMDVD